ncbi:unnamed protein product [Nesidiocoris tenuis]|uniref:Uncharacterized protein n=1 Tax=Nesidiocoris tenuis TaxID=355587 RepID=A0A6H5GP79_9HEMI|nr:unnamed protein product [Nesidiocoris tenuis]
MESPIGGCHLIKILLDAVQTGRELRRRLTETNPFPFWQTGLSFFRLVADLPLLRGSLVINLEVADPPTAPKSTFARSSFCPAWFTWLRQLQVFRQTEPSPLPAMNLRPSKDAAK